jgi:hypothetical protein
MEVRPNVELWFTGESEFLVKETTFASPDHAMSALRITDPETWRTVAEIAFWTNTPEANVNLLDGIIAACERAKAELTPPAYRATAMREALDCTRPVIASPVIAITSDGISTWGAR